MKEQYTTEELLKMARSVAQQAKEVQNTERRWSEEDWRRISKVIERIEALVEKRNER